MSVLAVTSPTADEGSLPASIVYLVNALDRQGMEVDILDLGGEINYYDPPRGMLTPLPCKNWLSSKAFYEEAWLDKYIHMEKTDLEEHNLILYSALTSQDVLVHGRHLVKCKEINPECVGIIGGAATNDLTELQTTKLKEIFDVISFGPVIEDAELNYSLLNDVINKKNFMTIDTGRGCYYGKCNFCTSYKMNYYCRPVEKIINEFEQIACINPNIKDVMLSSDAFDEKTLMKITSGLIDKKQDISYNIMLRAEKWISDSVGMSLKESKCTDVFIGAEALNNDMLKILNKGVTLKDITNAIRILSKYTKVSIGLILFIPSVTKRQLDTQLNVLKGLLPYLHSIELESLSIIQGSAFSKRPELYGINLWTEKSIDEAMCFGFSPNIPWLFQNKDDMKMWLDYYEELKNLAGGIVEEHYLDSIEYIKESFNGI